MVNPVFYIIFGFILLFLVVTFISNYRLLKATFQPPSNPYPENFTSMTLLTPYEKVLNRAFKEYVKLSFERKVLEETQNFYSRKKTAFRFFRKKEQVKEMDSIVNDTILKLENINKKIKNHRLKWYHNKIYTLTNNYLYTYRNVIQSKTKDKFTNTPFDTFSELSASFLWKENNRYLYTTPWFLIWFNLNDYSIRIVSHSQWEYKVETFTEQTSYPGTNDEIQFTTYKYMRLDGGPDRRYSNNTATYHVLRGLFKYGLGNLSFSEKYLNPTLANSRLEALQNFKENFLVEVQPKWKEFSEVLKFLPLDGRTDETIIDNYFSQGFTMRNEAKEKFNQYFSQFNERHYSSTIWPLIINLYNTGTKLIITTNFQDAESIKEFENQQTKLKKEIEILAEDVLPKEKYKRWKQKLENYTTTLPYFDDFFSTYLNELYAKQIFRTLNEINFWMEKFFNLYEIFTEKLQGGKFVEKTLLPYMAFLYDSHTTLISSSEYYSRGYKISLKQLELKFPKTIDKINQLTLIKAFEKPEFLISQMTKEKGFYDKISPILLPFNEAPKVLSEILRTMSILKIPLSTYFDKDEFVISKSTEIMESSVIKRNMTYRSSLVRKFLFAVNEGVSHKPLISRFTKYTDFPDLYHEDIYKIPEWDELIKVIKIYKEYDSQTDNEGLLSHIESGDMIHHIVAYATVKRLKNKIVLNEVHNMVVKLCQVNESYAKAKIPLPFKKNMPPFWITWGDFGVFTLSQWVSTPNAIDYFKDDNYDLFNFLQQPIVQVIKEGFHRIKTENANDYESFWAYQLIRLASPEATNLRHPLLLKKEMGRRYHIQRDYLNFVRVVLDLIQFSDYSQITTFKALLRETQNLWFFEILLSYHVEIKHQRVGPLLAILNTHSGFHTDAHKVVLSIYPLLTNDNFKEICMALQILEVDPLSFLSNYFDLLPYEGNFNPQWLSLSGVSKENYKIRLFFDQLFQTISMELTEKGYISIANLYQKNSDYLKTLNIESYVVFYAILMAQSGPYIIRNEFIIKDLRQKQVSSKKKLPTMKLSSELLDQMTIRMERAFVKGYSNRDLLERQLIVIFSSNELDLKKDLETILSQYFPHLYLDGDDIFDTKATPLRSFKDFLAALIKELKIVSIKDLVEEMNEEMMVSEEKLLKTLTLLQEQIVRLDSDHMMLAENFLVKEDQQKILEVELDQHFKNEEYLLLSRWHNPTIVSMKLGVEGKTFYLNQTLMGSILEHYFSKLYRFIRKGGFLIKSSSILVPINSSLTTLNQLLYRVFIQKYEDYEHLNVSNINGFFLKEGLIESKVEDSFFIENKMTIDEMGRVKLNHEKEG